MVRVTAGNEETAVQAECDRLRSQVVEMTQFMAETWQNWIRSM
jgi:hypothetical protein